MKLARRRSFRYRPSNGGVLRCDPLRSVGLGPLLRSSTQNPRSSTTWRIFR
ncbi:MAG: hypothetical protein OXL97_06205 [Chloroflexota bacterium]|nr:hypothetical protein [Chloroflexota bacterium]MDE2885425.1 hypothetical protein [Chloroflexota bacterium]